MLRNPFKDSSSISRLYMTKMANRIEWNNKIKLEVDFRMELKLVIANPGKWEISAQFSHFRQKNYWKILIWPRL